jgi:uncharacterized membrane protein YgdD (TMEM256/DUF423 family)
MDTLLDILTGIGLACAAGIRPFLPGLAAGAFAAANLTIDFDGTDLSFLESTGWLLALVVALVVAVALQRRMGSERLEAGPFGAAISGLAIGVGAVLFAGALADHSEVWWPGLLGGLACALIGERAARDLLGRTRSRLDPDAREALIVYADGAALVIAVLAILVPPLSLVALGVLVWLLAGGRRRKGEKYAGLRILR